MNINKEIAKNVNILKTSKNIPVLYKRIVKEMEIYEGLKPKLSNFEIKPLENNILEWHGNIKGDDDTIYKNGIFHFKMIIPTNYPWKSPQITILTPIDHPNILKNNEICWDILCKPKEYYYKLSSKCISLSTIFIQLHNFFNDGNSNLSYINNIKISKNEIEKNIIILNDYLNEFLSKLQEEYKLLENNENLNKNIINKISDYFKFKNNNFKDIKSKFKSLIQNIVKLIKMINTSSANDIISINLNNINSIFYTLIQKETTQRKESISTFLNETLKSYDIKSNQNLSYIIDHSHNLNKELSNFNKTFENATNIKIKKIMDLKNKIGENSLDRDGLHNFKNELLEIDESNIMEINKSIDKLINIQSDFSNDYFFNIDIKTILNLKNEINTKFKSIIKNIIKNTNLISSYNLKINNIKNKIIEVNKFECKECGHGKEIDNVITVYPYIMKINKNEYLNIKSQKELYEDELKCFHSGLNFKNCILGYGVNVIKKPITGEVLASEPSNCFISLNSFQKQLIREDIFGNKFNYFFPIFLGDFNEEAENKLDKKNCSFILNNYSNDTNINNLRIIFPNILFGCFSKIIKKITPPDHSFTKIIINLVIKNLKLFQIDEEYKNNTLKEIEDFKIDESFRHKDYVNNISIITLKSILLNKFNYLKDEILDEIFIRQIFFIILKIKEFEELERLSENTLDYIFGQCKSAYLMYSFFYILNNLLDKYYLDRNLALKYGKSNYGLLEFEFENNLHRQFFKILKFQNFKEFFDLIEKPYSIEYFEKKFKNSINLSKMKGYHGNIDKYIGIKTISEQYIEYNNKYDDFLSILQSNFNNKDYDFKNVLFKNFPVFDKLYNQCKFPIGKVMKIIDNIDFTRLLENDVDYDEYQTIKNNYLKKYRYKSIKYSFYKNNYSFKDAYIKLSIEKELKYWFLNKNIKRIHEICNILEDYEVDCIVLPCTRIDNIKSKYYYLNIIINRWKNVKNYILKPFGTNFDIKYFIEINKAFNKKIQNFKDTIIQSLNIFYLNTYIGDNKELFKQINSIYSYFSNFKCVKFLNSSLLQEYDSKLFFLNILIKNKNLKEIYISSDNFTCSNLFEGLIDGLVKNKSIENIIIKNLNNDKNKMIELFLYNLTFLMNLKYLNLSGINNNDNSNKFWSNLGKLVSISNEIVKIKIKNFKSSKYIKDFFNKIGLSNSLRIIDLSNNREGIKDNDLYTLSQNIAFNSKLSKSQKIEELYLNNILNTKDKLNSFFEGFMICSKDIAKYDGEEELFGQSKIFDKLFCVNQLKLLSIEKANFGKIDNIYQKIKDGKQIYFIDFIKFSKYLEYLNINYSHKDNSIINLIWYAFNINIFNQSNNNSKNGSDSKINTQFNSSNKLKVILMDDIGLASENIKNISKILKNLKNLEVFSIRNNLIGNKLLSIFQNVTSKLKLLDIYKNLIGVDISEIFLNFINRSDLEYLDIGFNNMKNKGILNFFNKTFINNNSKIKFLGISHNNFNDYALKSIMNSIYDKNFNLEVIFCKHNKNNRYSFNCLFSEYKVFSCIFDCFNKLKFYPKERLNRMVWVSKFFTKTEVLNMLSTYITNKNKVENIILNIFNKTDYKKTHKDKGLNFTLIEFLSEHSVKLFLFLAKNNKINELKKVKVFKSNTSTYVYTKFKHSNKDIDNHQNYQEFV